MTSRRERVLVVEDDESFCSLLCEEMKGAGYSVRAAGTGEEARTLFSDWGPDLVLCDLRLPGMDGVELLRASRDLASPPAFILITAFGTVPQAVEALKAGADDFLTKPLDLEHLLIRVERTLELHRLRRQAHSHERPGNGDFHGMVGRSEVMRSLFNQIRCIAHADGPVLITGPSGVGKELVAMAVHEESVRAGGPFIPVNCAGIPENLLESEFFGHVAGAFTGAAKSRRGLFAEAQGGTLFLDEIAEMPIGLQAKLLRVLQDGKIRPVGGDREHRIDVRIMAATNRDLEDRVREGTFRPDLYYRLETFVLRVPALRERGDDLERLIGHFLAELCARSDKEGLELSEEALRLLKSYPFPGNVRELHNTIEQAVAFCAHSRIEPHHLPARLRGRTSEKRSVAERTGLPPGIFDVGEGLMSLSEVEERYIRHVLECVGGNKRRAAALLGIARRTLYRRLGEEETPSGN